MADVIFRVVCYPQVMSAHSAASLVQGIFSTINRARLPMQIDIQIGIVTKTGRLEWGELALVPGLGRWRGLPVSKIVRSRDQLWDDMLKASRAWAGQEQLCEMLSGFVAEPGRPRIVGSARPPTITSWRYTNGEWIREESTALSHQPHEPEKS